MWENIHVLKALLRGFELASGLKINFAKSQFGIIGGGITIVYVSFDLSSEGLK